MDFSISLADLALSKMICRACIDVGCCVDVDLIGLSQNLVVKIQYKGKIGNECSTLHPLSLVAGGYHHSHVRLLVHMIL